MQPSRRTFPQTAAALAAAARGRARASPAPTGIRYGYAAMTLGANEKQAIDDIAATGYAGIQFRIEATTEYQPAELKATLDSHKLTFVALSGGDVSLDADRAEQMAKHTANAKFVRDTGGLYLQVLDQLKPWPRKVTVDECKRLGALLTELGKRTADIGIPLTYHNHMHTISEHPENLDMVMESSDPRFVKLLLDTAHSVAGGGDPAAAVRKYHERMIFVHLKDVVDIPADTPKAKYPFEWVELGRGRVNLPAVFVALAEMNYQGWAVVELDRVPAKAVRTPKECALINRKYLEEKIGAKFGVPSLE